MKKITEISALILILLGSPIFGYFGRSAEMAIVIVAGAIAFALVNLEMFEKIKGAGFEATLKAKVEAITEKETEPDSDDEDIRSYIDFNSLNESTREVSEALMHPEYTWRYMSGLKKSTSLSSQEIQKSLNWLVDNGFARKSMGRNGQIWSLTEDGRTLVILPEFADVL